MDKSIGANGLIPATEWIRRNGIYPEDEEGFEGPEIPFMLPPESPPLYDAPGAMPRDSAPSLTDMFGVEADGWRMAPMRKKFGGATFYGLKARKRF